MIKEAFLRLSAKSRIALLKSRILLKRFARTRTAAATAQLGKALRADTGDVWVSISRAVRSTSLPDLRQELGRLRIRVPNVAGKRWLTYIALSLLLLASGTLIWLLHDLPLRQIVKGGAERVIVLEAADGQPLARKGPFRAPDKTLEELPPQLIEAVLSIEDRRFYAHNGVDGSAMLRALGRDLLAGRIVQGGSTITQQLVKILYLDRRQTLGRKLREIMLAFWPEAKLSKVEILTQYLNNVYLGAGATGIPAAALVYFGKEPSDLTLAESALLAGLIVAPSYLNPRQNPDAAQARTALVLDAMVDNGKLDQAAAKVAKDHPATVLTKSAGVHAGTWFADWAYGEAVEIAGRFQGTVRMRTTLVPSLQSLGEKIVSSALKTHSIAYGVTQAALVAMLPNGAVVAMVGGKNYEKSEFNRAVQAMRQPGSAFKLFVYYAALRKGISPMDNVDDTPLEIDGWSPENSGGDFHGRVSVAEAFARSLNAATVRLALEVGLDEVIAAARDLGLDAPLKKTPSLALGSSEVSLLDLTGAYASVRAGVAPIEPWGIAALGTDDGGIFRVGPPVKATRSLEPYQNVLVGLLKLVVDQGTGRAAALDGFAAGKTGTSQNYRDAWFIGFNEALVAGVWVGNDDDRPMKDMTGGKLPALIWKQFMTEALRMAAEGQSASLGEASASAADEPHCNYRTCERAYRSFRPSDCSYQPYDGPRRLCDK